MKRLFTFFAALFLLFAVFTPAKSQEIQDIVVVGDNNEKNYISIDTSEYRIFYKYKYYTNKADNKFKEDQMGLLVGKNYAKYYSEKTRLIDSTIASILSVSQVLNDPASYKKGELENIFTNFAEKNITYVEKIARNTYTYTEEIPNFNWQILPDKKEILGYNCQKAECDFRGRHYIAWFAPEIPISLGPWKFSGLPGLIMSVTDSEDDYSFEVEGFSNCKMQITKEDVVAVKTNRKKFLKLKEKSVIDPIGMFADSGAEIVIKDQNGNELPASSLIRSMNYEFLEKDYK